MTDGVADPSDEWNRATCDLILTLRGGLPDKCDFCGKPFSETRWPVPEEAGEWTCSECVRQWEENAAPQRNTGIEDET